MGPRCCTGSTTSSSTSRRYELRRDGAPCHVEKLVFDLLAFLVRNPGRVLGREEVVDQVWQGRAVSEATISSCVKAARRALGDSGEARPISAPSAAAASNSPARVTAAGQAGGPPKPRRAGGATAVPAADPRVLPFANLSAEADDYFADGLTEDIIMHLARFRDLRVIAGASTFRFKGRDVDLAEIRARLRAGYVVQGSVRRDAGRVRISAQLVDAANGLQLWGDRYDREMGDIFALQDEVTRTIAATLGVTMQATALQRALIKSRSSWTPTTACCGPGATPGR